MILLWSLSSWKNKNGSEGLCHSDKTERWMRMTKREVSQHMCEGSDGKTAVGEESVVFVCVNAYDSDSYATGSASHTNMYRSSHREIKGGKPLMAGWPYIMAFNHRHFSRKSTDIKCDRRQFVTVDSWYLKVTEDSELRGRCFPMK